MKPGDRCDPFYLSGGTAKSGDGSHCLIGLLRGQVRYVRTPPGDGSGAFLGPVQKAMPDTLDYHGDRRGLSELRKLGDR